MKKSVSRDVNAKHTSGSGSDSQLKEISRLITELVSLESPSGREQAAMRHLERLFERYSIPARVQRVGDRSNLISSVVPSKRPLLLLCSHMDTVPPEGSKVLKMKREPGRLNGLGACDAKASIVAMLIAYKELIRDGIGDRVALAFFVGEEESGDGGMTYIRDGYRPQFAIVGEPTELALPWAQAGYLHATFRASCSPRHAFCIHELDAIGLVLEAIRSVERIMTDSSGELNIKEKPNLFVQQIKGGSSDRFWYLRHDCLASLLVNIHPTWDPDEFISRIRAEVKRLNKKAGNGNVGVKIESWDPGFEFDSPVLRGAVVAAMRKNHMVQKTAYMRSWTDAATLMWKRIQTVVFGPGSLQHAHSPTEHVLLDEIRIAASVYRHTALQLATVKARISD